MLLSDVVEVKSVVVSLVCGGVELWVDVSVVLVDDDGTDVNVVSGGVVAVVDPLVVISDVMELVSLVGSLVCVGVDLWVVVSVVLVVSEVNGAVVDDGTVVKVVSGGVVAVVDSDVVVSDFVEVTSVVVSLDRGGVELWVVVFSVLFNDDDDVKVVSGGVVTVGAVVIAPPQLPGREATALHPGIEAARGAVSGRREPTAELAITSAPSAGPLTSPNALPRNTSHLPLAHVSGFLQILKFPQPSNLNLNLT